MMSTEDFELDPERRLWKPSRRSFFFGLGAALIAPMLPNIEQHWPNVSFSQFKLGDVITIGGRMNPVRPLELQKFLVTSVSPTAVDLFPQWSKHELSVLKRRDTNARKRHRHEFAYV